MSLTVMILFEFFYTKDNVLSVGHENICFGHKSFCLIQENLILERNFRIFRIHSVKAVFETNVLFFRIKFY